MQLTDLSGFKAKALDGLKKLGRGSLGTRKIKNSVGVPEALPRGRIESYHQTNGNDLVSTRNLFLNSHGCAPCQLPGLAGSGGTCGQKWILSNSRALSCRSWFQDKLRASGKGAVGFQTGRVKRAA